MPSFDTCWTYLVHLLNLITFRSFQSYDNVQTPINTGLQQPHFKPLHRPEPPYDYPIFKPPNAPEDWNDQFVCKYPSLPEYELCSNKHDHPGCWLKPKNASSGLPTYNIKTDYESIYPPGIKRNYTIDISNTTLSPDGCLNEEGKVFNLTYPGPWIEACWGDEIEVTVINSLPCNGTTVHWHGIRQLNTVEMDGVNAVTQCPIAPGANFTYRFRAHQYGSSWYHSHYSLQYADGAVGPLTIHGPSSAPYDTALDPIIMTDWNQRSAFQDWAWSLNPKGKRPKMTSILLNGNGTFAGHPDVSCTNPEPRTLYNRVFQSGVRYLLRLINTSVDSAFIFSIDGHNLTVIQSDFVPIHPYTTNSVLIGIGQRYHVVVEGTPDPAHVALDGNYWIRTIPADGCSSFHEDNGKPVVHAKTGIIRYDRDSTDDPTSTQNSPMPVKCSDEPYESLRPLHEWTVPPETDTIKLNFEVSLDKTNGPPYDPQEGYRWQISQGALWLNYSAPTLTNFNLVGGNNSAQVHLPTIPQDNVPWVEFLITAQGLDTPVRRFPTVAHPIHLHGHDFALLAASNETYNSNTVKIKRDNPPRRDVVLLPAGGYIIIAFKMDNPGVWLLHCHIAWHASSGLAMQVLENVNKVKLVDPEQLADTCAKWDDWMHNKRPTTQCKTYIPFQDDSGI
ncbi:hypothetical protein GQ43DRAFT_431250 [Delitschia confertaspora ATCC 74209]|uniref:Multicopper oxidase n=1 Tax=Delitschia confertaspora ATCC 74209 TaxID=1513339 RepID=A0A9P4MSV6_9PLEO|nr:hypothetical protein GQ43DRAFT_431250 [Delitschia confertaspora ATCC 74209]